MSHLLLTNDGEVLVEETTLSKLVMDASDDDPRKGLRAAAELRREVERLEAQHVRRARNRGMSWAEIAGQLGVSKQAVHNKYGGRRVLALKAGP